MAGKLSKKVLVRANVSHDGLRAGKVYRLLDTDDLRRRESQKLVSIIDDEPDEKPAPTRRRRTTKPKDEMVAQEDAE